MTTMWGAVSVVTVRQVRRLDDGWQRVSIGYGGLTIYVPPIEHSIQINDSVSYFYPADADVSDSYWRINGGPKIAWPTGVAPRQVVEN